MLRIRKAIGQTHLFSEVGKTPNLNVSRIKNREFIFGILAP